VRRTEIPCSSADFAGGSRLRKVVTVSRANRHKAPQKPDATPPSFAACPNAIPASSPPVPRRRWSSLCWRPGTSPGHATRPLPRATPARPRTAPAAAPPPVATIAVQDEGGGRVIVDVAGAVKQPGVYRLAAGARVEDALQRAGGATRRADLSQVNRAAKLEDG